MSVRLAARPLDQSELRTQQALGPLLLVTAYIVDEWSLVAAQCAILAVTALRYDIGPYVLLYRLVLRPLGIVRPDVREDNLEAHRFAMLLGVVVLAAATYLLATAASATAGWILAWLVAVLGGMAFLGWCAGCFTYYLINRPGVTGFFANARIEGSSFPGARPPRNTEGKR